MDIRKRFGPFPVKIPAWMRLDGITSNPIIIWLILKLEVPQMYLLSHTNVFYLTYPDTAADSVKVCR
jgi:hypothetical protein